MIFSGSSKFLRTLLRLDLATRENRSKRFIDKADVDENVTGVATDLPTNEDLVVVDGDMGAKALVVPAARTRHKIMDCPTNFMVWIV